MEKVEIIDPCTDPRWDKFVENHPCGWIVHLSGWKTVLEKAFPQIKGHYLALINHDNENIIAGLPIYETRSWLTGKRLVSIPFATLCNILVSKQNQSDTLISEAISLLNHLKLSYIEIRVLDSTFLRTNTAFIMNNDFTNHYIDLSSGEEELWKTYKNKTIGRWINKAFKSNLQVRIANNEKDILEFYKLYAETRKRLGLPAQPYSFFKAIFDIFAKSRKIEISLATLDDKIIAGHLYFRFKRRISVEAVGDDANFRNLGTNHFLYWKGIQNACAEGFEIFDFGRTSVNNTTLMDFKKRWGTSEADICTFYHTKKKNKINTISNEQRLSYKLIQHLCEKSPSSIYSVLSNFCYRHLG